MELAKNKYLKQLTVKNETSFMNLPQIFQDVATWTEDFQPWL
jgi:hypothetical protein